MKAYPALPLMSFDTSKKEMALERTKFALAVLNDSGLSHFSLLFTLSSSSCCESKYNHTQPNELHPL